MQAVARTAAHPSRDLYRFLSFLSLLALIASLLTGCASAKAAAPVPEAALAPVREAALPVQGQESDYDPLLEMIGGRRFVLLGDSTHGTHEFYRERAKVTLRLIREKGFDAVAIEGDWDDAERVNRYVRGLGKDASAEQALSGFRDFPVWMWNNTDVRFLVEEMRKHNASLPPAERVGFYGLDLYGVAGSLEAVPSALASDRAAAERARKRYACFSRYKSDLPSYGLASPSRSCEAKAVEQLQEVQSWAARHKAGTDPVRREELFSAVQHARTVRNGEAYYRTMAAGTVASWNLRDRHMAATLEEVAGHLSRPDQPAKVVVWAHNSHLGDARSTQRAHFGELNLGQLVRQRHGDQSVLVGFTTYTGTVTAASTWGERGRVKQVRPALQESWSGLFRQAGIGDSLLLLKENAELAEALEGSRPERAIGVLYLPQEERRAHYFEVEIAKQFDAVVYFDETRAVERLR